MLCDPENEDEAGSIMERRNVNVIVMSEIVNEVILIAR
jgi:hypothetical protein